MNYDINVGLILRNAMIHLNLTANPCMFTFVT